MAITKFIQHTILMIVSDPVKAARRIAQKENDDPFLLQTVPNGIWISGTAAAAKSMFSAGPETFVSIPMVDEILLGPDSLLWLGGESHLCQKRAMLPMFNVDHVKQLVDMMQSCVFSEINRWQPGQRINVSDAMRNITFNVIANTIFGVRDTKQIAFLRKQTFVLIKNYTAGLFLISALRNKLWPSWRKFSAASEKLDRFLLEKIKQVRRTPQANSHDILSTLAAFTLSNGQQWTADELCAQLRTLLFAGYETTATTLAWAIFYIYSRPEIQVKLLAELQSSANLSIEDIVKLPYLDAVCKEVLRLKPITLNVIRTLANPMEFANKRLPAGSNIGLSIDLLHTDPSVWNNPTDFDPDRFLTQKFSNYEYAPFGGGTKKCLGVHFAMYEIKITLTMILLNCQFSNITTKAPPNQLHAFVLRPKKPIFATIDSAKKGDNLFRLG